MKDVSLPCKEAPPLLEDSTDSAPAREASVVHSSFGRLRVHLPHWTDTRGEDLAAGLILLPGVTHAEANPVTRNVLILFETRQTSASALIEALPALRPVPTAPAAVIELDFGPTEAQPRVYMTGAGRVAYKALGWLSVGMAVVGAILPGIPTAPFVVLAGYFFVRSSPESHQWLRQSRWFGTILRDWEDHGGVRRSVRNAAVALIGAGMVITTLLGLPTALLSTILICQLIGLGIVMQLKVVELSEPELAAG